MSYNFDQVDEPAAAKPEPMKGLRLPTQKPATATTPAPSKEALEKTGKALGFVSRQTKPSRRKPGPKRLEPQGKITVTGPQRVIDALQARSEAMGDAPYWQVIEELLGPTS